MICIEQKTISRTVEGVALCIASAVTVAALFTILSTSGASAIIGASLAGPAGAGAAAGAAGITILAAATSTCIAASQAEDWAAEIIWCGVKSLYV